MSTVSYMLLRNSTPYHNIAMRNPTPEYKIALQRSNAKRYKPRPTTTTPTNTRTNTMSSQSKTGVENPFADPVDCQKRSADKHIVRSNSTAELMERTERFYNNTMGQSTTTKDDKVNVQNDSTSDLEERARRFANNTMNEVATTKAHKPCDCSSLCHNMAKAVTDFQLDADAMENMIYNQGLKDGYKQGRDKYRGDCPTDSEIVRALEDAEQTGWEKAMDAVLEMQRRQRQIDYEEDYFARREREGTDDLLMRERGEGETIVDLLGIVDVLASKVKKTVKAKMAKRKEKREAKGKGKAVEEDEEVLVEKEE